MTTATPDEPAGRPRRRTLHRGDPDIWAWALHRITGAAIFFFLFVHVLGTALVRVSPQAYNEVAEIYQNPLVVLLQAGLLAAVLFHALNGIRVILIDVWAHGQRRRRAMLAGVGAVWLLLVVPALVVLGVRLFGRSG